MFKKPLSSLKTSAPLRSSDRRKLKQRIVSLYGLQPEEGDILMPEGILSMKFNTHIDEQGTAYLDTEGNPLWFTIGKGSEDLIPTTYTLWKKEDLLPFLSTPAAVIPILIGGADLMIPGVIHCPPSLGEQQLVAIRQYSKKNERPALSPPLAVGRMALPSNQLKAVGKKGKAVLVIHTWKDRLWEMGSKGDMPEDTILETAAVDEEEEEDDQTSAKDEDISRPVPAGEGSESAVQLPEVVTSSPITFTPDEVTELLNKALLQAVSESLTSAQFPIPATTFYTNYILPSRPAFPTIVLTPASLVNSEGDPLVSDKKRSLLVETDITIKTSSHKSLTTFLKAAEKAGLLTLKPPQKPQPDVLITSVNAEHPNVKSHKAFVTVKSVELKEAKKAARIEKSERENQAKNAEVQIKELWKPHQSTLKLFEAMGASKTAVYSPPQVNQLVNNYIKNHNLMNQNDQACVDLDEALYACTSSKGKEKAKTEVTTTPSAPSRVMRRDELLKTVIDRMQNWYEIRAEGKDALVKKGTLSPIHVVTKVRQGRKACTLITDFEPFLVINAQEMADDLRKICAGATSVGPVPGKPPGSNLEVLVQGKQSSAVVEYLQSKGIPKKWIEVSDLSGKK